jgi:NAD(P)-dependent dehydrogenase (short-subunit alcohol dehydrogenase family)
MQLGAHTPAIVTGGASGLGEATARMLAAQGCAVSILDADAERGERVATEIGGVFIQTDVADAGVVAAALRTARERHGQERICVNCAGIAPGAKTVGREGAHDPVLFEKTIRVNLLGVFNVASQSAAGMVGADPLEGGERGVIVNTASIAAYEGQIGQLAYAASKGGVVSMTLPMARDLARDRVRVMGIAPGLFLTPMMQGLPAEVQESLGKTVPYPDRLGDPAEFAALVRSIAENPMLNGEVIRLDGALRMAPR